MSERDSPPPPPYDEDEPVTGIHDVPYGMRAWAQSYARRVKGLAHRFDDFDRKFDRFLTKHETERGLLNKIPTILAVLALVASALAWYVHATAAAPPPPPSADQIAEKIIKLQAQH